MLKKRIIPCLDIKNGRTVKGINFEGLRDAGDPVALAQLYVQQGADELVFLDISATREQRKTLRDLVGRIAAAIDIPFTVGGGIQSVQDAVDLVRAGADKISINTAAVIRPGLITEIAKQLGSQCVTVAIDTKPADGEERVFIRGGSTPTSWGTLKWAQQAAAYGAGEILLTAISRDGTQEGFALGITNAVSRSISIPVIASGGAGKREDFLTLFRETGATGALAASIFHFGSLPLPDLKTYLKTNHIPLR
jgi:cyclase